MENIYLPYITQDEVFEDFSIYAKAVMNCFINPGESFAEMDKILLKMQKNEQFNVDIPVISAINKLELTKFEKFCMILLVTIKVDHLINTAFFKALKADKSSLEKLYNLSTEEPCIDCSLSNDGTGVFEIKNGTLVISDFFTYFLETGKFLNSETQETEEEILIYSKKANEIYQNISQNKQIIINVYGDKSCGKRHFTDFIANKLGKKVISIDFDKLRFSESEMIFTEVSKAEIFAKLTDGIIYLHNVNSVLNDKEKHILSEVLSKLENYTVFVATFEKDTLENRKFKRFLKVSLWDLSADEKISVWQHFKEIYNADIDAEIFGNKYVFNIGEIKNTFESAKLLSNEQISEETILKATKMRDYQLEGADLISTEFTFDDLVVDDAVKRQLDHIINQLKFKNTMYNSWGFDKKIPYGRGISSLFYGPPGTGKTMTASVIANELKLDLYRIDLSKLISKYIGETEKNITNLFDKAKNMNVILFFDEADALFAKRSEVRDSNDKNSNAETAHLLQKLEEYEGISILATNLFDQLDDAFRRRIKFMVPFVLPSEPVRLKLWQQILPKEEFLDEVDIEFFAENFELSGSQIKEIVLNASFIAISEGVKLSNKQIKEAVTLNYQKYGKRISNDDFLYLA